MDSHSPKADRIRIAVALSKHGAAEADIIRALGIPPKRAERIVAIVEQQRTRALRAGAAHA